MVRHSFDIIFLGVELLQHSDLLDLIRDLNHEPEAEAIEPSSGWYERTTRDSTIENITLPAHVELQMLHSQDMKTVKFYSSERVRLNVSCIGIVDYLTKPF